MPVIIVQGAVPARLKILAATILNIVRVQLAPVRLRMSRLDIILLAVALPPVPVSQSAKPVVIALVA